MKPLLVMTIACVLTHIGTAGAATAQRYKSGWIYTAGASLGPVLGKIHPGGAVTTIVARTQLPYDTWPHAGTMDVNNQNYAFTTIGNASIGSLYRVDRAGNIVKSLRILKVGPRSAGGYTTDVAIDPNGDYLIAVGRSGIGGRAAQILKVDRSMSVITTVLSGPPLIDPTALAVDALTGNILVFDVRKNILSVSPDGATVNTIGSFQVTTFNQFAIDNRTGDIFKGSFGAANVVVYRMTRSGAVTTFLPQGMAAAFGMHTDRSSAANQRLMVGSSSITSGFFAVDMRTRAMTTIVSSTSVNYQTVFPDEGRNVHTIKTGPGRWSIGIHFPGEAGNGYQLALSLSGVVPGVPLAGGRHVSLNFDDLTRLSVNGLLGPILAGQSGSLSALDRGLATLDVSSLPRVAGVRVYMTCVTLNPSAPFGWQTISEPWVIVL